VRALEEVWRELEVDQSQNEDGILAIRVSVAAPCGLLIGVTTPGRHRVLRLEVPASAIPAGTGWPNGEGFDTGVSYDAARRGATISVTCLNGQGSEVFAAFAEDLRLALAGSTSARACVEALLQRITVWQRFFARGSSPLGALARAGLFGELYVLRNVIVPAVGTDRAVQAWVGPKHEQQDFHCPGAAVEVKSTRSTLPGSIRVTSMRQLDPMSAGRLLLLVVFLKPHVTEGESLAHLVGDLRMTMQASSQEAAARFDDLLVRQGYLGIHEDRYTNDFFEVRLMRSFEVSDAFPSIREDAVPRGVEDVSYSLDLSVCEVFVISNEQAMEHIRGRGYADRA
jgi:hypothetical protein